MVKLGCADGLVCGTFGRREHIANTCRASSEPGWSGPLLHAMNLLMLPGPFGLHWRYPSNYDPTAERLTDMALLAEIRSFGITPRWPCFLHSTFGTELTSLKMREVPARLGERAPGGG